MALTYVPIEEITDPVSVALGLSGPSGTGKTYSALRVARGMARAIDGPSARFALLDSEDGRGRHYRADFPELLYRDFRARDRKTNEIVGFPVERWIGALEDAEREGIKVLAIDAFSHSWGGVKGVLDTQAEILARLTGGNEALNDRMSQLAWAQVKPPYRRLVERLTGSSFHVVVCSRAKPVIQTKKGGETVNARSTKLRRRDVPFDIEGDADLIFNMTVQVMLSPDLPGRPGWLIKAPDGLRPFFDAQEPLDEALGRKLIEWSRGDQEAERNKRLLDNARDEARKGTAHFREWWKHLAEADRFRARSIMDELTRLAEETDRRAKEDRDGPGADPEDEGDREDA